MYNSYFKYNKNLWIYTKLFDFIIFDHMEKYGVKTYDVNTTVLNMGNHLGIEDRVME